MKASASFEPTRGVVLRRKCASPVQLRLANAENAPGIASRFAAARAMSSFQAPKYDALTMISAIGGATQIAEFQSRWLKVLP
jgi:hypothetical protein